MSKLFLHPKHWYLELLFLAGISSIILGVVGAYWDIGWHFDYGRDTFWSPPHLFIYGSVTLTSIFFILNLVLGVKHNLRHKNHALWLLLLVGLGSTFIVFSAAPLDELWHRIYSIDIQIFSFPHLILIFGGVLGAVAIIGILRYHMFSERKKFLLEKILIPVFFAGILMGLNLIFAESEFTTLPLDHPVADRSPFVYPTFYLSFAILVFTAVRFTSNLRWAATITCTAFVFLRFLPVLWNTLQGMSSVPIAPSFLPLLFGFSIAVDLLRRVRLK